VQTFCNGLQPRMKMILGASFSGLVLFKTAEETITIIEYMASTDLQSHHGMTPTQKKGVLEFNALYALLAEHKLQS